MNDDEELPDEEEEPPEPPDCPFCGTTADCEHFLLEVDETFRCARGGALHKEFSRDWSALLEQHQDDPSFDERAAFEEVLWPVRKLAQCALSWGNDGGPGQSSAYEVFFCSGRNGAAEAAKGYAEAKLPTSAATPRRPRKSSRKTPRGKKVRTKKRRSTRR